MDDKLEEIKKKYDVIGWGLLFLLIGILSFVSGDKWNIFFIGLGAIIIVKNIVLYAVYKISPEWFMVIIGAIVLIIGFVNEFNKMGFTLQLHFLEVVIIVVGAALLIKGILKKS